MSASEIQKFVQKSLEEVNAALPNGFRVDDKIHFDISLVTTAKAKGELDIKIASLGSDLSSQNIHRLRFSIIDEQAQLKGWQTGLSALKILFQQISKMDKQPKRIR